MKKKLCSILCFFTITFTATALDVNTSELEDVSNLNSQIEFENYGGPYAVIESASSILNIGTELGRVVAEDVLTSVTVKPEGKYTLIHAISEENKQKFSGDILILNEDAGVDHIKNLRRILTGYLMASYGYSQTDAETLSVFITIYNAVYRGQINFFTEKFNDLVSQNLLEQKVGLSTYWEDWPGKTQIVIPLGYVENALSSVDTTEISDENVIEALEGEDDKGIDVREQLTELKEREMEEAQKNAQEAQKNAAEERKAGNTEQAQKEAAKSAEQQNLADKKREEVKSDKAQIAKDKENIVEKPEVKKLTGLFVADEKKGFYKLLSVNALTGEVLVKSPVNQIRNTSIYTVQNVTLTTEDEGTVNYPELFIAVCGTNNKKSAVRLCLLDTEKLELKKQSAEILSEKTELINYGENFYAVIKDGKSFYLAIYDKNLNIKSKSSIAVKESTPINISQDGILISDSSGKNQLLNLQDLTSIWNNSKTKVITTSNEK